MRRTSFCRSLIAVFCCLLAALPAVPAYAGIGLSFDLISFGPFSLGIDIPVGRLLPVLGVIAAGAWLISHFSGSGSRGGGGSYHFAASYGGRGGVAASSQVSVTTVEVSPDRAVSAGVLRIWLMDFLDGDRLRLAGGGALSLRSDGKLWFEGTRFEGYLEVFYDKRLAISDPEGEPVLVIAALAEATVVLQEKSEEGRLVMELLFGEEMEG